ncbi:MAG: ABC transporter ATP-binding protein [Micrococcales bacterium]|nr:ABC transporter ATP-binding protein [Micrococcales bacterium]
MHELALEAHQLKKRYRSKGPWANDGLTVKVPAGQVVALLGPNGAGKTTLISQVVGLLKPDSGTILVGGVDAVAHPAMARRLTALQPQGNIPLRGLSPAKAIGLAGAMRGGDKETVDRRRSELIGELSLEPWATRRADQLSGGVARLTSFCLAAVVPGCLAIFDEPTNDVDPARRQALWKVVRRLASQDGVGVLVATHNLAEAEDAADQVVLVNQGKALATGSPGDLAQQFGSLEGAYLELVGAA